MHSEGSLCGICSSHSSTRADFSPCILTSLCQICYSSSPYWVSCRICSVGPSEAILSISPHCIQLQWKQKDCAYRTACSCIGQGWSKNLNNEDTWVFFCCRARAVHLTMCIASHTSMTSTSWMLRVIWKQKWCEEWQGRGRKMSWKKVSFIPL